ncbi:MAG TPA: amidohydrolase family protein [Gemmatimonadota bacterium]|nr:amidohydrolase family protein [Gemmatimonadota bacterium]
MQPRTVVKWSLLGVALLAIAGVAVTYAAYSRGRYLGPPDDGTPVALVGGRIYDLETDSLIEDVTVLIRGREIAAAGPWVPLPDSARVIDVRGLTLLPGLIDSHAHLSGIRTRASDGARELGWPAYLWRFIRRFPDRRQALIEAGVTSVKSLGDPYPWIVNLANRIDRHELAGPRIFAAGPYLTAPGGYPVTRFRVAGQGDTSFIAQVTRQLANPADAATAVKQISGRVDYVTTVLETRGTAHLPRMSPSVLRSITSTAHDLDLRVLTHVSSVPDVKLALRTGVDGLEHVPFDAEIDSATLATLAELGIVVAPTLQALEEWLAESLGDTAAARRARHNTQLMWQSGVPLVAGSDAPAAGTAFGFTLHEELRNLVEIGYSPGQAIAAATIVAAAHLGIADRLGTVATGKWADIIAVGGEPWAHIESAADVYLVIADGRVLYDRLDEYRRRGGVIAARTNGR